MVARRWLYCTPNFGDLGMCHEAYEHITEHCAAKNNMIAWLEFGQKFNARLSDHRQILFSLHKDRLPNAIDQD